MLAVLLRLFFIWIDRNIAEHLVLCLYVYGHNYLIQAILVPLRRLLVSGGDAGDDGAGLCVPLLGPPVRATGLKWYIAVPISFAAHLVFPSHPRHWFLRGDGRGLTAVEPPGRR